MDNLGAYGKIIIIVQTWQFIGDTGITEDRVICKVSIETESII